MRIPLAVFAAALCSAGPVLAQDDDNAEGFYLGAGLGDFSTDIDEIDDVDDADLDPIFGVGIGVTIAERVILRAEYEVVEIDQLDDSHAVWRTAAWRF